MNMGRLFEQGLEVLPQYLTALGIGLLIGLERERNPTAKAGLRTCALVSLAGAVSVAISQALAAPYIVAVGLAAVAAMIIAAYYPHREPAQEIDSGTTTTAAVILCYLLGAMVLAGFARLAVILGVLAAALLHFKAELGGVVRTLERKDIVSILQFALLAFVILPLLPDRNYGPYGVLNPREIWLMVVLISGLSLSGYVALRLVGNKHGGMLIGFFGGLVSSTATTLAYARHAHNRNGIASLDVTVIVTASLVLLLRLAVVAAIVAYGILPALLPVLAAGFLSGAIAFAIIQHKNYGSRELEVPPVRNPAELGTAFVFGMFYVVVLLISAWLIDIWGSEGVYVVALVSGSIDVDAIWLTNLHLYDLGQQAGSEAVTAIVIAVAANAAVKLGIVRIAGSALLFRSCLIPVAASLAGMAIALSVLHWST
jgi:uncharacterized membrane protein (DUF4010 family)